MPNHFHTISFLSWIGVLDLRLLSLLLGKTRLPFTPPDSLDLSQSDATTALNSMEDLRSIDRGPQV